MSFQKSAVLVCLSWSSLVRFGPIAKLLQLQDVLVCIFVAYLINLSFNPLNSAWKMCTTI